MLVFHTQIHIVTFVFMVLETIMFLFQLFYYLFRPEDKARLYYLILLILLLFYNITGGLFPDPNIYVLSVPIQEMIAYGSGFLMASYFPFYFYKAFYLKALRWHAYYGVPLFLIGPYIVFFVIDYAIHGNLDTDLKYGMIAPFIYALVLLWVMFRAIRSQHQTDRDQKQYLEEVAMYIAISPWAALAFFGLIEESQLIEVLFANTGIIAITCLFIWKSIQKTRLEYRRVLELQIEGNGAEIRDEHFNRYNLTKTEREICQMIIVGKSNKEIADVLYISEETVKKHIYNTFRKMKVKNRAALIYKLQSIHFSVLLALFAIKLPLYW